MVISTSAGRWLRGTTASSSEVSHQGFVAVDERGTDAAAATAEPIPLRPRRRVAVKVHERDRLEYLCRYVLRPALALDRLLLG
jgi:hypothetical protein